MADGVPVTAPFSYRRRVGFGDCDPARIYYTPRAFNYCVEAVEAWWESTLSDSWSGLLARGLEARILHAGGDFLRPLTAGQEVRVRVRVPGTGPDRLRFRLTGEGEGGEPHFRASVAMGLYDRERGRFVPIPADDRARIGRYEAACGSGDGSPGGGGVENSRAGRAEAIPEAGGTGIPPPDRRIFPVGMFTRTRRVVFGDCSPSGTVDPPKVFEYAIEAAGEWFETIPGVSWLELVSVRMQGAPAVAASCEFHRPMAAGQEVEMGVRVLRLGRASIVLSIEGNDPDGLPLFDSQATLCFIDQRDGFRSMPLPDEFRRRIEAYHRGAGGEGTG